MSITVTDRRRVLFDSRGDVVLNLDAPDLDYSASVGSFQHAMPSNDRGFVYVPTLDSKKEVDSWSRRKLNERSRFIYNNGGGLPYRLVDGVARQIIGTGLIPIPMPIRKPGQRDKIKKWSSNVRDLYMARRGKAKSYDMAGRRNVFQDSRAGIRCKIVDGDSAKILVRDLATGRLKTVRYEASQIGNGVEADTLEARKEGWHDGILCGQHNEILKMRILSYDDDGKERRTDIPAANVLHSHNDERIHQVRGLTRFHRVASKVLDLGEIRAKLTGGIKVAQQTAYVIEQALQQANKPAGYPGSTLPVAPTKLIETNDGKKITVEQFLSGNQAYGLKPGQSFKIVSSQNPSANVAEYLRDMIRDISWSIGVSPEIAWNIIEAGGANMRFIQADFGQFVEVEQDDWIDQDLGPDYIAWLYDMIVAGDVEEIDGWERHAWLEPMRLTVDFGREGTLHLKEYEQGVRTMQSMYGLRGEIAEVGIETYLDERQMIVQGIIDREITERDGTTRSMTFEEAFPGVRQQAMNQNGTATSNASSSDSSSVSAQLTAMQEQLTEIRHVIDFAREPKS